MANIIFVISVFFWLTWFSLPLLFIYADFCYFGFLFISEYNNFVFHFGSYTFIFLFFCFFYKFYLAVFLHFFFYFHQYRFFLPFQFNWFLISGFLNVSVLSFLISIIPTCFLNHEYCFFYISILIFFSM